MNPLENFDANSRGIKEVLNIEGAFALVTKCTLL